MPTSTNINELKINILTKAQYDGATKNADEIYCVSDDTSFLLQVYPVGSIYMSINSTSPATLFGGTWERIFHKFLLAADNNTESPWANAGVEGGAMNHTLTVSELPSHTHTISSSGAHTHSIYYREIYTGSGSYLGATVKGSGAGTYSDFTASSGAHTHTVNNTGSGTAFSTLPPYLAVYMWKRTA